MKTEKFNFASYAHSSANTTRERIQNPIPKSSDQVMPLVQPISINTPPINQNQILLSKPATCSLKPLMSKPKFNELLKDELINRLYMIKQAIAKLQDSDDNRSLIG